MGVIIKDLWMPILFAVLSIWNIIKPFEFEGPIVIKFAKKNENTWNFSQRLYSILLLILCSLIIIFYIILRNQPDSIVHSDHFGVIKFIIVLIIILIPIPITYIGLQIKFDNNGNYRHK